MSDYLPEGMRTTAAGLSRQQILQAVGQPKILEARAVMCDSAHNLIVELGSTRGIIPKEECALGIREGTVRDIAILSRVNKPVCFAVTGMTKTHAGEPVAVLSRRTVQQHCMEEYLSHLSQGDVIPAKVTHLEPFGAFVDVGCGIVSLIPIDAISVSRISHPSDRFWVGQDILAVVRGFDHEGKLCLTHKELLGTWEENAAAFSPGQTVAGIVRSIENYGIFVELTPNLAGLAESRPGVEAGQQASVYIKSLIPEKMKVKLILVDSFQAAYPKQPPHYFFQGSHMDRFVYSPACATRQIVTDFTKPFDPPEHSAN